MSGSSPGSTLERDQVRCRVCRRVYRRISASHLRRAHRLGFDEYRQRFPGAVLTSEGMRREMSRYISRFWESRGRHWTRERVLRCIRGRVAKKRPLDCRSVCREEGRLYRAAARCFGSWDTALREAGLDPERIRLRRRWTRFALIRAIRANAGNGKRKGIEALSQAARSFFGSWREGLMAAGLTPLRRAPVRWTRRRIRAEILARASSGLPLAASHVHDHAAPLWRAARRLFRKRWAHLLRSLGVSYPRSAVAGK